MEAKSRGSSDCSQVEYSRLYKCWLNEWTGCYCTQIVQQDFGRLEEVSAAGWSVRNEGVVFEELTFPDGCR